MTAMNLIGRLIAVSDALSEAGGLTRSQQSYQIFRDQRRLDRAFAGTVDLRLRSYESAMQWFSENWPDGTPWPERVERPSPERKQDA